MIIEVLVELSNQNIDKTFDYIVPKQLQSQIKKGIRVIIPFGKQILEGFVLNVKEHSEYTDLKEIIDVVDEDVVLNEELLELGKYISKTYLTTLISAYQVMLPKALKARRRTIIHKKINSYLIMGEERNIKLNSKQIEIINLVKNKGKVLKKEANLISSSSVKTLLEKRILKVEQEEVYRLQHNSDTFLKHPLTDLQISIVNKIYQKKDTNTVFLLHGVTGSGKTEVYMELIEKLLKENKESIVLVPEISLTQQMVDRFQKRFSNNIAILHSRLNDGEKYDEWRKIARGEVKIAIGARSAIFAPFQHLGIIIIDEEHTTSYKQENNPKYSAIEIAKVRAKFHHCPVVLGSATPTLESYARSKKGVYELLEMPERIHKKELPKVEIMDMNQEMKNTKNHFSNKLLVAMQEELEKDHQVILLLNRRGYSSFISCKNCGYVEKCPNCDITLTYHKSSDMVRCHYCGYANKKTKVCPNCKEEAMTNLGLGTEKIEEELTELFPDKKVIRMDFDTTSQKGSHEKIIKSFEQHEYDILLGTQMIAKGFDFPLVTLVGVINADTSLNIPDFRSSEYTYQLLSQVAGRSGRGEESGRVMIQTFNPEHYAILYSQNHDYLGFYTKEMSIRHKLNYPPYYYLTVIKVSSKDYDMAKNTASKVGTYLENNLKNTIVLGPSIASVFKLNNVYRFQIILKYKKEENLYFVLNDLLKHYQVNKQIQIDIDFNPTHI